ncbi:upstream stimulatory factor 2 isoform X4 [Hippopotamus amphibius kiboko]|uniref:upstream stimulatory factor 2 isoform X4 n=1 Tax=Hippopotamus amphibius kiboko TaxID=575201 RepID=UPI0025932D6A|nr:upstream stimulatory factor 2 isoform X4 [Hippopotamus amphibius kiboko]
MDMLDPGLDPAASATAAAAASHDKGPEAEEGVELQEGGDGPGAEEQTAVAIASVQQAAFGDHNIQYQFRTENNGGQVTYRVVQVTDGQLDGQGDTAGAVSVVSTAAFAGGQQAVTQVGVDGATQRPGPAAASVPPGPAAPFPLAVIQNPFSNGGSPAAEAVSGEARFAYFPASSVGDTTAVSVQTTDQSLQAGGQFYVMMTPQDVLQTGTQRTIAPRTHPYSPKIDGTRTPRDERRRAQHNEVERRRRDKINNWIVQLSKIIPDCNADNSKTGASKGGILSKACDYIRELRQTNQRMQETFKEAERLQMDNELLRQQPPLSPGTSSGLAWRQEGGGQSPCHTPLPPWTLETPEQVLDLTAGQPDGQHDGAEQADLGHLSPAPPPGQPDQWCRSPTPDQTASRPPDPGHSWSRSWLDACAPETKTRHPLPHLRFLLRLLS